MLSTFLFDLDGTIWDSKPLVIRSLKKVISDKKGINLSKQNLLNLINKGSPIQVLNDYGINHDIFWKEYTKHYDLVKLFFDDTSKILQESLDCGKKLGVVTSLKVNIALSMLENFGLTGFFSTIVTPSDTSARKPSPKPVLIAVHRLKSERDKTIYIGDQEIDLLAAKSAGCYSGLAGWSNNTEIKTEPDFRLSKLRDILHLYEG